MRSMSMMYDAFTIWDDGFWQGEEKEERNV
jgi:hypothetical protein